MGRKSRYEADIKSKLADIADWYQLLNEGQIAKKLGISRSAFEKYKTEHSELREALKKGRESLVVELKNTLKQKAQGFHYTESKKTIRNVDGVKTTLIEEYDRYSPPDTGAIHLLLKNLDDSWRNDDKQTMDLKKQKIELEKQKADNEDW